MIYFKHSKEEICQILSFHNRKHNTSEIKGIKIIDIKISDCPTIEPNGSCYINIPYKSPITELLKKCPYQIYSLIENYEDETSVKFTITH